MARFRRAHGINQRGTVCSASMLFSILLGAQLDPGTQNCCGRWLLSLAVLILLSVRERHPRTVLESSLFGSPEDVFQLLFPGYFRISRVRAG